MRILVVEDEESLANQVAEALRQESYAVDMAHDGEEGHYLGDVEPYDLIVLDIGLPVMNGIEVLKKWRADKRMMPVLILTARDSWTEKVDGFDAGADDYLTKPFHMAELKARARALIRRSSGLASTELSCGEVVLDTSSGLVKVAGKTVDLTSFEYKLLSYFLHHPDKVLSKSELVEHIYEQDFDPDSNTVEVFVGRLRKKLNTPMIKTVRGLGYRLETNA